MVEYFQCKLSVNVQLFASISEDNPPQYSDITIFIRLLVDGYPQSGLSMTTFWHYKSTTSYYLDL